MPAITNKKMSQVLIAEYITYSYFVIPKGLAKIIDNKDYVKDYGVKWNTLYINLTNGETIEIQMKYSSDPDYSDPDNIMIEDLENHPFIEE